MLRFSTNLKEAKWDDNPTLEEMQNDLQTLIKELNTYKKFKVAYGYDDKGQNIKAVVTWDHKEHERALYFVTGGCEDYETLQPVYNDSFLIKRIKNIIKIAEEKSMEQMKETKDEMIVSETTGEMDMKIVEDVSVVLEPETACVEPNVETEMVQQESLEAVTEGTVEESEPEPEAAEDVQAAEEVMEPESAVVESNEVAVEVPESVPVLNPRPSKEDVRAMLENRYGGVKFISPSEVRLTEDDKESPYLILLLKKNKTTGGRVYHFDEIVDGEAQCQNNPKADFDPDVIKNGGVILENFIINRQGDYSRNINAILSTIQSVENNRLLTIDKFRCINHAVLTAEEFMRRIQAFFKNNPFDERIAYIEGGKTNLLGVVGRGNYTAYQNFRRLVNELAPENDVKRLKDNLFARGCFITDSNDVCKDAQKTLSLDMRKDTNIRGDKMYAFDFDEHFMEEFKLIYKEQMSRESATGEDTNHEKNAV